MKTWKWLAVDTDSGKRRLGAGATALLVMLLGMRSAHALTGTITGQGHETLTTSSCGSDADHGPFTITLRTGRKWRLVDHGGSAYTGSFTSDASQRNLVLYFDAASESRVVTLLKDWSSSVCRTNVRVKSYVRPVVMKVRINAQFTRASGSLALTGVGKTASGSGSARFTGQFANASFKGKRRLRNQIARALAG